MKMPKGFEVGTVAMESQLSPIDGVVNFRGKCYSGEELETCRIFDGVKMFQRDVVDLVRVFCKKASGNTALPIDTLCKDLTKTEPDKYVVSHVLWEASVAAVLGILVTQPC